MDINNHMFLKCSTTKYHFTQNDADECYQIRTLACVGLPLNPLCILIRELRFVVAARII